ncbi:MAG: GTP cyclohydrolase II [Cyclobacteriaceae bacterium]
MVKVVESVLPTKYGDFNLRVYSGSSNPDFPDLVLYTSKIFSSDIVDVRIHSECMTGDVFSSAKCDCGEQLNYSMKWMQENGGIIIYLRQEGRGIGLVNKLLAYNLQDEGYNTREANLKLGFEEDQRDYKKAIDILNDLDVKKIRLLTNNPEKVKSFDKTLIEVVGRIPIEITPNEINESYLHTKKHEMGHLLSQIQ